MLQGRFFAFPSGVTMKAFAVTLAACASLALASAADDPARTDADKLQGSWKLVASEIDGKKAPEESVKTVRMTVKGDRIVLREENKEEEASFKLDPAQTPRALDLSIKVGDKMEVVKLIYELRGDDLKLCGGRAGKDRPKEFMAKAGSGLNLIAFKRDKE
jgi:uncharacterized protein (TIGR03067 family)